MQLNTNLVSILNFVLYQPYKAKIFKVCPLIMQLMTIIAPICPLLGYGAGNWAVQELK